MNHNAIRGRADEQLFAEERNERENEHFIETAVLRKDRTKLPVNIFLDDEGRWMQSGHLNLIKFQPDTGERADSSRMVSLSIEDEPRILDGKDFIKITPS